MSSSLGLLLLLRICGSGNCHTVHARSCSHSPYHRIVADGELQLYLVRSHCWLLQETSICRDLQRSDAILSAGWVCQDSVTCTELLDAARNAKHGLYHGSSRFVATASIRKSVP